MKSILTAKCKAYIKANRLLLSGSDMAAKLGVSKSVVNRYMRENGLSISHELKVSFRAKAMTGKTTFTKAEDKMIRDNYLLSPIKVLGTMMNRSFTGIMKRIEVMGLELPAELRAERKTAGQIKAGNISFNKGKKLSDYVSPEAIDRMRATQFHKGQLPHNTKSDLEISVRPDNRGVKYNFIRVSVAEWVPLHHYVWEKANGKLPPKMKLVFKDGDPMNCRLDNLEMLTPAQLMMRNTCHNYPKPIAEVIQLRGALTRQINKHLKKLKHEK